MKHRIRISAVCLLLALLAGMLAGCGKEEKPEAVKQAEAAIAAIGEVSLDSEEAILAAEEAYAALSEADRAKVENYGVLTAAREELDRQKEAAYQADKQELIDRMAIINSSFLSVTYGEYLIMDNAGADQFQAYHEAVRDFNEEKPLSEYEGDPADLELFLWAAAYALCPEYISGSEIQSGRELAVIRSCCLYNREYDRVATVEQLVPLADAFFEKYGTDTEELANLKAWYDITVDCAELVLNPSGTVNSFLQGVIDYTRAAEPYIDALGVNLDDYKTMDP